MGKDKRPRTEKPEGKPGGNGQPEGNSAQEVAAQAAAGIAPVISLEERQAMGVAINILQRIHAGGPMKPNEIRQLRFNLPDGRPFFAVSIYKRQEIIIPTPPIVGPPK